MHCDSLIILRQPDYLSTVIQISMLAYFHNRVHLATMISEMMSQRFDEQIPDSVPSPGQPVIENTLAVISSQTCAFGWSPYSQEIENRLRQSIPNYCHDPSHSSFSSSVLLGAIDLLCIVQSLPEDRKVSLSSESGCIPMILWAHYILGLTVVIELDAREALRFGTSDSSHLYIKWHGKQSEGGPISTHPPSHLLEAEIALHERDMAVILEKAPDKDSLTRIRTEERHPIRSYGTDLLRRIFNHACIVANTDPIYPEVAETIIALAVTLSHRVIFNGIVVPEDLWDSTDSQGQKKDRVVSKSKPEVIEVWRVLRVGSLMFEGIEIDANALREYTEYYKSHAITEKTLPNSFAKFLSTERLGYDDLLPARTLLNKIGFMVKVLIALSHISDIKRCSALPLLYDYRAIRCIDNEIMHALQSIDYKLELQPCDTYYLVVSLFSTNPIMSPRSELHFGNNLPMLFSDFGWSVISDIIGDKDPADVNWMIVHVRQGEPTRVKTNERRQMIVDGPLRGRRYGMSYPEARSAVYLPRAVAASFERREFWSMDSYSFNLSLQHRLRPSSEYRAKVKQDILNVNMGYGRMLLALYMSSSTPACEHLPTGSKSNPLTMDQTVKLGPDAIALLGWRVPREHDTGSKVLVVLTRGVPVLRWDALLCAGDWSLKRRLMLVTPDCCETCAMEYTAALPDKWILVL